MIAWFQNYVILDNNKTFPINQSPGMTQLLNTTVKKIAGKLQNLPMTTISNTQKNK